MVQKRFFTFAPSSSTVFRKRLPQQLLGKSLHRSFLALPRFLTGKQRLFLSMLFFEQEGISKEALLSSRISEEAKKSATQAFSGEKAEWHTVNIPDDLYEATLELIGINLEKLAKGGT